MDPRKNRHSKIASRPSQSCCQCNTSLGYRLSDDDQYSMVRKCLPPCHSAYFSDQQSKSLINNWLTILSILCVLSCTLVLLTFFLDMTRFKYPQRPIIFLSLCYFFVACGYLIRILLGHENVACRLDDKVNNFFSFSFSSILFLVRSIVVCSISTSIRSIELCVRFRSHLFLWHGFIDLVGYFNINMVPCSRL